MGNEIAFYIGVDGGGTKCLARMVDIEGNIIGEGRGGPTNIRLGLDLAWENVLIAIDQCLEAAKIGRDAFPNIAVGLGLAGVGSRLDAIRTCDVAPNFGTCRISSDAHIACLGAFDGGDGAILISGTGSVGSAFINGKSIKIGGWGFEVNDDASGASLGREALRASLHAYDGLGQSSDFTKELMKRFDNHPLGIVRFATNAKPKDYGSLAPLAIEYAENGDPVAVALVEKVAVDLGHYMKRLSDLGAKRICLLGGLAVPLKPWLAPWTKSLLFNPQYDAQYGAILLAKGAPDGLV